MTHSARTPVRTAGWPRGAATCGLVLLFALHADWPRDSAAITSGVPPPPPPPPPPPRGGFPPSLAPGCLPRDDQADLFCPGDSGYGCFKIPTMLSTRRGTLLAMIEARKFSCDDHGYVDLLLRRSTDGGETWAPAVRMYGNSTRDHWTTVGDGNFVQDAETGTVWLLHTRNNSDMFLSRSDDDGVTWSPPVDANRLKRGSGAGTGHDGGRQLSAGPHRGRLLIPVYSGGPYVAYSDDHGRSWHVGGTVPVEHYAGGGTSAGEWTLAETGSYGEDGTPILLASVRNAPNIPEGLTGKGYRVQSLSRDGGLSWGPIWEARDLPEPLHGCEGSLVHHPSTGKLYFSHPDPSLGLLRNRMKVWSSSNLGATWTNHTVVWDQSAGYSSMVVLRSGDIGIFYDRNNHSMLVFEAQSVSFTTFTP